MTREERRKLPAHHIVHDYVHLVSVAAEMRAGHKPTILNHHLFAAFMVHYRKFADFFANRQKKLPPKAKRRRNDVDMLAKEFVNPKLRFPLPEWKKWEDHMNTHHFHLNRLRTRNSRPWTGHTEVPKMFQEFNAAWKRFFDNLQEPYLSQFRDEVNMWLAEGIGLPLYRR